jgi:alpha-L-fucosidase
VYGEGPSVAEKAESGRFGGARDVRSKAYTTEDYRFTARGDTLYAFMMAWPDNGKTSIKSLSRGSQHYPKEIARVELLGAKAPLKFVRDESGLVVNLPDHKANDFACALKITPKA